MAKYHVNPKTGRPNLCNAKTPESCLYYNSETNTEAPHFDTKADARGHVEKTMNETYGNTKTFSKPKTVKSEHSDILNLPFNEQVELIKNDELSFSQLEALAKSDPKLVTEIVWQRAQNGSRIPQAVIAQGIKTGDEGTKELIAQQDNLTVEQVRELSKNKNRHIRAGIAKHNLFHDTNVTHSLVSDINDYVAATAWENFEKEMKENPHYYKVVYASSNPNVRQMAAASKYLPVYAQAALANDKNKNVKMALTKNLSKDPKVEKLLAADTDAEIRASVMSHTNDKELLDRHSLDRSDQVVESIIKNNYTTPESLERIKNYPDMPKNLKALAARRLNLEEV